MDAFLFQADNFSYTRNKLNKRTKVFAMIDNLTLKPNTVADRIQG